MRERTRPSVLLILILAGLPVFVAANPSAAAALRVQCAASGLASGPAPWAQQLLGLDRVAGLSTGAGVTVAVLDTGVDSAQPGLRGRVQGGADLVATGQGNNDCVGLGTQLAGIVAAGDGHGVAPRAEILPVRVIDQYAPPDPQRLAAGVDWAVAHRARVVLVGLAITADAPSLRSAVARAIGAGVAVVAPAGDQATQGDPTPYPAAYPDVVGVGAVDSGAARAAFSQVGPYVDLVAPGVRVATLQRGTGLATVDGTAAAAAFVAGALALVLARYPDLTAAQATDQLMATAAPAAGHEPEAYGHGLVDPYAAVSTVPGRVGRPAPPATPLAFAPPAPGHDAAAIPNTAVLVTAIVLAVALVAIAVAAAMARGGRRRWRPGLARPMPRVGHGEPGPPVRLFQDRGA
jgi:subtilisin family serine protease